MLPLPKMLIDELSNSREIFFKEPKKVSIFAASGSYFATTWVKPGERAILQGTTTVGKDMYVYYDSYEATDDIAVRFGSIFATFRCV